MFSVSVVLVMHAAFSVCLFLGETQGSGSGKTTQCQHPITCHRLSKRQTNDHVASYTAASRPDRENSGALSNLLDGLQLSTGPKSPVHQDVSPIARLPSRQDGNGIISKRINPSDMFALLNAGNGPEDNLMQGSSGYSSGMSSQQLSGVFVGYSTNQGSNPDNWEMTFSGAVEGTEGGLVQGREPRLPSTAPQKDQLNQRYPQNLQQQNQQQQQQRPQDRLPQKQQQQSPQEQQQGQGQQQQGRQSGFNPNDGSHNAISNQQLIFSNNQNLQNALSAVSINDLKPTDMGRVPAPQQTGYQQSQIGSYQSFTQTPNVENPQPLIYPQQFGNTDQLSHQATSVPDILMGKQEKSDEDLPTPRVDTPKQNAGPTMQSKQENQNTDKMSATTDMDSIKQQLDSLQKLISQLQQQQQELSRLQQQQQQQQPPQQPVAENSSQPSSTAPTSSFQNDSETTEIGTAIPKGEKSGQSLDNDFGNTAGAQNAVSEDNVGKQQQPVFLAGGPKDGSGTQENSDLYNNNNNNDNYAPTPTISSGNAHGQTHTDDMSGKSDLVHFKNITTPKMLLPTTSAPVTETNDANAVFDPQAVNELANQKFNPLNPLYGVDLQQYLGYQTGGESGGFDATKLNTQLAQQGMQLGRFSNNQQPQTGQGNPAQTTSDHREVTTVSLTTTGTIMPEPTTVSSRTLTSGAPTSTVNKPKTTSTSMPTKPTQPATIAPVVAHNQNPAPSRKPNKPKPEFGDVGGGLNLMNPSSMIGMMSSGRPVMAGNKPGEIFRLDNDQGMFGTGIWESPGQNQDSSNQLSWFGTNGPAQRLTVPLMANPLDPLGVMSSGNRRKRSANFSRRMRRQTDDANNVDVSSISRAFGFDPNRFYFQAADRTMNNGLGGCCPTNAAGMQTADSGHRRKTLTISGLDSSPDGASTHLNSESDFGNTATSGVRSTGTATDPYGGRGTSWDGQWPNSMSSAPSSNELTSALALDLNGEKASTPTENGQRITTWDGSWMSSWPGFPTNSKSGQDLPKPDTTKSPDSKMGNAIAMVIARNMGGNVKQQAHGTMSNNNNNNVNVSVNVWGSHMDGGWKINGS